MWIFLDDAFYSIVEKKKGDRHLLVRARFKGDIERHFPHAEVKEIPGTDYRFRADVDRLEVVAMVNAYAFNIDYPNFKDQVVKKSNDPFRFVRVDAYSDVWEVMYKEQHNTRLMEETGYELDEYGNWVRADGSSDDSN